ncbi:hypothetical protein ACUH7Y_25185 [Clostridium beijerinckii]|uniref:Uncharacterized protein n=1 Tax=Clostridium beijerinckii TaxID=1520 RepID=A0A7X9SMA7_CLOBE|nr:hypothetical protein [Clostridium beijerinckii]NMF04302.1 hypothetical protein [Clostridium beijerinckii]
MIFIRTNEKNEVTFIRYNFNYDLNEFDVNEGYVLDKNEPEIVEVEGKQSILVYDKEHNELYYKYIDIAKEVDPVEARLNELEAALVEIAAMLGGAK